MSEHFEGLEQAVRESATLEQRIAECRIRISRMCSEKRPPRMSIPVRWNDDDTFIVATLKDCDALRAEVAALNRRLDEATNARVALENVACLENTWLAVEGGGHHRAVSPDRLGDLYNRMRRAEAELAKYTEPLTEEQAGDLAQAGDWPITPRGWKIIDAAIRRVRGKK